VLPASLQQLVTKDSFNQPLDVGVLPLSLTHLWLGQGFNQLLPVGVLPPSLQVLRVGGVSNQQPLLVGALPQSLVSLSYGSYHSQDIGTVQLPSSIERLTLLTVRTIHWSAGMLPRSLQVLYMCGTNVEKVGANVLPLSVRHLSLGTLLNHQLDLDSIHPALIRVSFSCFTHLVANSRPLRNTLVSLQLAGFWRLHARTHHKTRRARKGLHCGEYRGLEYYDFKRGDTDSEYGMDNSIIADAWLLGDDEYVSI
jgi:hypothetical protein